MHCFRCGERNFVKHEERSIAALQSYRANVALEQSPVTEPRGLLRLCEAPPRAYLWMAKYGVSPELAEKYGIKYRDDIDRTFIPVYDSCGNLDAVQYRALRPDQKPKYINPTGPKVHTAVFMSDEPRIMDENSVLYSCSTVITEDIISAIKVGQVLHACSILGTSMTNARALKIQKHFKHAYIWLDGDKAGLQKAPKVIRTLELFGVKCTRIITPNDPKTYNTDQIKEIIDSARRESTADNETPFRL